MSRSRGIGVRNPIARSAVGSSQRMLTPGAVLIAYARASLLRSIGGYAPTVPTRRKAGFNTNSESIGPRHIGDRFERFGNHLGSEFPEPSWRPMGGNRNTLGTAVKHLGPTTPERTSATRTAITIAYIDVQVGRSIPMRLVDGAALETVFVLASSRRAPWHMSKRAGGHTHPARSSRCRPA